MNLQDSPYLIFYNFLLFLEKKMNRIALFFLMLLAYGLIKDLFEQYFGINNPENFSAKNPNQVVNAKYNHSLIDFAYYFVNIASSIFGAFGILLTINIPVIYFTYLKLNLIDH